MIILRVLFLFLSLVTLGACAGKYTHAVHFNPAEPLRIAVLPFQMHNSERNMRAEDKSLLIDEVSLISSKLKEDPEQFLKNLVQSELSRTSLDVIAPALVEAQLSHHGFYQTTGKPDVQKIYRAKGQEICDKLLQCDALLYGQILRWDRDYYGLESSNAIAFHLKLVSAKDGSVLFETSAEDSESRGLTKGPTGFSALVIEPIKGLSNEVITELARKMVERSLAPLLRENRPEFLSSPPPALFASAQDATDGIMTHGTPLTVLALGTPKLRASFSIGDAVRNIPMTERDEGHYFGEFIPLPGDKFAKQTLTVSLTDKVGRTATQTVGKVAITLP